MVRPRQSARDVIGRTAVALAILAWFAIPRDVGRCCASDAKENAGVAADVRPPSCCAAAGCSVEATSAPQHVTPVTHAHPLSPDHPAAPLSGAPCHGCPAGCCGKVIPIPDCVSAAISASRPQFVRPSIEAFPGVTSTGGIFHPPRR